MIKKFEVFGHVMQFGISINSDNKIALDVYAENGAYISTKIVNLTYNKCDVIRINKKGISTINNEMLTDCIDMLEYDHEIVHAIHEHFIYGIEHTKENISIASFVDMFTPGNIAEYFNHATHETRQAILRYLCCDNHTAKMAGMISYSTLVIMNKFCIARMQKAYAVCKHCFAARQLGIYADQLKKLAKAHAIATMCVWFESDIPALDKKKFPYFRLESFGDINNTIQVNNYNVLADTLYRKYGIKTTLWTKNPGIIQKAINNGMQLSECLTIGLSSLELNTPEIEKAKKYSFIKFLFTVFTPEYVAEHDIKINCGGLHCRSCLKCYELAANSDTLILINELLK